MQNNEQENVDSSTYLHAVEKYEKVESVNTQWFWKKKKGKKKKNKNIKRKQTCSVYFVKVFK